MSVLPAFVPQARSGVAPYPAGNSLRLRRDLSAYFSRTPGAAGNRRTWTWSGWVKRGALSTRQAVFISTNGAGNDYNGVEFLANDQLAFIANDTSGVEQFRLQTSSVWRDPNEWLHIVAHFNTTAATASDRAKFWVTNSTPSFGTAVYPPLNYQGRWNNNVQQNHGSWVIISTYADLLYHDVHFIDGQALDPSYFGETDANGQWVPKAYSGSYGTNGYHLEFADSSSANNLVKDTSGNGNNWTATNISVSAGAALDQLYDVPKNNFCALNFLNPISSAISGVGLISGAAPVTGTFNALAVNAYWEISTGVSVSTLGIRNAAGTTHTFTGTAAKVFGVRSTTNGTVEYRNLTDGGAWTTLATGLSSEWFPYGTGAAATWNFGQQPFAITPPSGYAALSSFYIPAGTITTSGTFTGNADANGPDIFLNGVPTAMTINGNAVTLGTHADKTARGFKVRSSSASYNTAGSNTYSITSSGATYKRARAQGNP